MLVIITDALILSHTLLWMSYALLWGNRLSVHIVHGLGRGGKEMPEITVGGWIYENSTERNTGSLRPTWRVVAMIYIFPIWLKMHLLMNSCFSLGYLSGKSIKFWRVIDARTEDTNSRSTMHHLSYISDFSIVFFGCRFFELLVCVWEVLRTLSFGSTGTRRRPSTA